MKEWNMQKSSATYTSVENTIIILFMLISVIATSLAVTTLKVGQICSISEHTCANGRCIPLNKFCNNINDCGDGSDEPRFCTRCNRTYYGDLGLTYSLDLHRPKVDRVPYLCVLTFTATGGIHGDIIQITLERFTLGRFTSYTKKGCPDGYLQISEASRMPVGGKWCGTSWSPVLFYSETRSLVMTIKLNKLARDQKGYNFDFRIRYKMLSKKSAVVRFGGNKSENMTLWYTKPQSFNSNSVYDFTNTTALSNQYGPDLGTQFNKYSTKYGLDKTNADNLTRITENKSEAKYYLGDLIPGTYCSRIFSDCDRKICRVQSPNFPGVYPRNLTCYYAVRQHDVPHGKHALIGIRQQKGNLIWVATQTEANSQNNLHDNEKKPAATLKTWNECSSIQDYVTVYDGYTTRDPVILKFCGGGQEVPAATSSGPELLVEFTTSPYGTFSDTKSKDNNLYGFELEVEVKFVDQQSPTYVKNKKLCDFWIRGTGYGFLTSPQHSLPPNSTCLYHLQGTSSLLRAYDQIQTTPRFSQQKQSPKFKVWLSILKFDLTPQFGKTNDPATLLETQEDCSGMLRIWDGQLREPPICKDLDCESENHTRTILMRYGQNFTKIITRFCYGTISKTCDRVNINDTFARPCALYESYISSGDFITLELKNRESTVLRPLDFKLRYEFVDLQQDGLPLDNMDTCNRKFVSNLVEKHHPRIFRSVRNVFLFGRGGATQLKCIYKFEAQRGERIRIRIHKVETRNRECTSRIDRETDRSYCFGNMDVKIEIFEHPYHDSILLPRGCLCNSLNNSDIPFEYMSTSRDIEVHLTANNMTALDDPDTINFDGTYEFIKGPITCKDSRRKFGPSGTIDMTFGDIECRTRPWLIEPSNGNRYIYVRLRAIFLKKYDPHKYQLANTSLSTNSQRCETKSRAILTRGDGYSITACPLSENSGIYEFVEIFSAGWQQNFSKKSPSKVLSIEFLKPDNGDYQFTWMEMEPIIPLRFVEDCKYKCPELKACVNASTWCDGTIHCPSGGDESFLECSPILKLPAEILATLSIIIFILCSGFTTFVYRKIKRKCRGSSILQTRLKSLGSTDTAVFDEKDIIC